MPHLLELFSGTGSIGHAFRTLGWRVTSVYPEGRFHPTIVCDVLDFDPRSALQGDTVDLVWGAPPCTHYSIARTSAKTPRDLEGSDRLVRKTMEIARDLQCPFLMQNPTAGC